MAVLIVNKNCIAITCGNKAIVLKIGTGVCELDLPAVSILEPPFIQGQQSDIEECEKNIIEVHNNVASPAKIDMASFSPCNKWLVLCSSNKQLSLWNTEDWTLLSNRVLVRSASSVKFTPSSRFVVVADKSGDAYQYSVENPLEKGSLLLGHLSMLLDILVTPDENYIITCDRDEKIRVSNFPNAYNIHSYCLGHEQFVTHIDLLPHDVSVLLSSSGDGNIIFWDYALGIPHLTVNCSEHWSASKSENTQEDASVFHQIFPVKTFSSYGIEESVSIICALLSGVHGCLIYKVCNESKYVVASLVQVLNFESEPWDSSFISNERLWILISGEKEPIREFVMKNSLKQSTFVASILGSCVSLAVSDVNKRSELFACISPPTPMTVLYKRKFDNVQEYHERKKMRQLGSSKLPLCS